MAERAKLRKQEVQAIQAQIERSEEFSKFTVNSIVKVPRDYWGKKYASQIQPSTAQIQLLLPKFN